MLVGLGVTVLESGIFLHTMCTSMVHEVAGVSSGESARQFTMNHIVAYQPLSGLLCLYLLVLATRSLYCDCRRLN